MGIFDFFKEKKDVVDLSGHEGIAENAKTDDNQETEQESENQDSEQPEQEEPSDTPNNAEEKKKKLVKRIVDLSDRMEELSSKIYRLQQRVEVLEKKSGVNKGPNAGSEEQEIE